MPTKKKGGGWFLWFLVIIIIVLLVAVVIETRSEPPTVTVTWTAPGDDGHVGTAAEYDIRFHADSTTLVNWTDAVQVNDEPAPDSAGTPQTYTFTGLQSDSTYYVALRTRDEASNWSGLSNILRFVVPDKQPPADVTDLAETGG